MVTQIPEINALNGGNMHATYYHYDQLNRINLSNVISDNSLGDGWNGAAVLPEYRTNYSYDGNGNLMKLIRLGDPVNLQMDHLDYHYIAGTNQLDHVTDDYDGLTTTDVDIEGQASGNYQYDDIGNLISDASESIEEIHWLNNGKIEAIVRYNDGSTTAPDLEFRYDPEGNRIVKIEKQRDPSGLLRNQSGWKYTYYFRDAQGNVLSTAQRTFNEMSGNVVQDTYTLNDHHIYGSKRLGVELANKIVAVGNRNDIGYDAGVCGTDYIFNSDLLASMDVVDIPVVQGYHEKNIGVKRYEMSNHLGNVLAVLSNHHEANSDVTVTELAFYNAKVMSASDYYPFGMVMPGRSFASSGGYRYGFNGMEKDDEVSGDGNSYAAEFWQYDVRLGRRWNIDPVVKIHESPYAAFANNPILLIDPSGADTTIFANPSKYDFSQITDYKEEVTFKWGEKLVSDRNFLDPGYITYYSESATYKHFAGNDYFEAGHYLLEDFEFINLDYDNGQILPPLSLSNFFDPRWVADPSSNEGMGWWVDSDGYIWKYMAEPMDATGLIPIARAPKLIKGLTLLGSAASKGRAAYIVILEGMRKVKGQWINVKVAANQIIRDSIKKAKLNHKGLESGRHGEWMKAAARDLNQQAKISKARGDLPELYQPLQKKATELLNKAKTVNHKGG